MLTIFHARTHRISAGAIISRNGKILLVRHKTVGKHDFLVLPGGGAEDGESAEQAAIREAREEAGVCAEVIRLAYVEEMHILGWRECKLWFYCKDLGGGPSAKAPEAVREDIVSAGFYSRDELMGKTVYPPELERVEFWRRLEEGFPTTKYLGLRQTDSDTPVI